MKNYAHNLRPSHIKRPSHRPIMGKENPRNPAKHGHRLDRAEAGRNFGGGQKGDREKSG